ncbi:hypothetical protein BC567DRAFT_57981 [Phyllosticta citribraziliensis]
MRLMRLEVSLALTTIVHVGYSSRIPIIACRYRASCKAKLGYFLTSRERFCDIVRSLRTFDIASGVLLRAFGVRMVPRVFFSFFSPFYSAAFVCYESLRHTAAVYTLLALPFWSIWNSHWSITLCSKNSSRVFLSTPQDVHASSCCLAF